MQKPSIRTTVLMVLPAVTLTAAYFLWSIDRRTAQLAAADEAIAARINRMVDVIAAVGTAQQSYVAPGQLDEPAFERMTTLLRELDEDRAGLAPLLRSPGADASLQALAESSTTLAAADGRTRQNLSLGQELMAADVIFSDGRNLLDGMIAAVRELHAAERAASRSAQAALARERWVALGAGALVWLGAIVMLAGAVRRTAGSPATTVGEGGSESATAAPPAPASVDLGSAAALCTDLACVADTAALSGLLARAASVLDARGLILWMGAGEQLFAVFGHGYDESLARFGPIRRDDASAAAGAWRTGRLTVVAGDGPNHGGLVVPLCGPDGCVGVLAAEIRSGREQDSATQALAAIFAAQLATVVAGWPAASVPEPAVEQQPEARSA